jgi:hypothetical protein
MKSGVLRKVHVTPFPHSPPHAGPLKVHGVLPAGMQPQSKPPDTQMSPGGHVPSHAGADVSPHGVAPATHSQLPATYAQTGVAGGHSP